MALLVGDKIPEILGKNQEGKEVKSADYLGKKLVLYFYPKDNTPGCTAQACSLKSEYSELQKQGYQILGVSADSEKSHQRFIAKHSLPFDLIVDEDKTLSEQFGTWAEKKMYGRTYMGMLRTTFIINEEGIIEKIFNPKEIKTKEHAIQILSLQK